MNRVCPTCARTYPDAVFFCGEDGVITVQEQDPERFDARLGKQLGGYIVVAHVADGAMGRVYEGRHPETKSRVAIKVLHDHVARDAVSVERFKREYETAREMSHPNVVKVLEYGETSDHSYFLTMEYLQGQELRKVLASKQRLPKERIVRIASQVAVALDHAHSFGFIHRDLKPDNIFLCETPDGADVRVLDFGSVKLQMETGAKLTAIGTTLGSPYYMSPEQAMGAADVDQRSDVFALGAILYEMITNKVAFEAPNVAMILMKIMNETPTPPSSLNPESPHSLDDVVEKAIRKDKKARYAAASAMADAMLAAYGLNGTAAEWAHKPEAEIASALAAATPAAPKPFGHSLAPAVPDKPPEKKVHRPDVAAEQPSPSARPSIESSVGLPPTRASSGNAKVIVGVAIGIAVLGLLALLMR
ncbi:MAG TPA: serine/threonine-protein kinase [Polyangiales bacterium]